MPTRNGEEPKSIDGPMAMMNPEVRVRIRVVGVETTSPLYDEVERIACDAWEKVDRLIHTKG
jgi:hypothetical protein